jgi:hypothetical protein
MENSILSLEQLYDCTDRFKRQITQLFALKTERTLRTNQSHRFTNSKRLSHRTLYSLWKTKLQMFRWKRTWSEILSVSKSPRAKTGAALCPTGLSGKGKGISEQLSDIASAFGRNLQHKPRNLKAERKNVKGCYGYHWKSFNSHRPRNGRNIGFKYASGLVSDRTGENLSDGGGL